MGVLLVVRSNLFLFAAKVVFALPVVISIPFSALLLCLSKSFSVFTGTASSPSPKNFASSSAETVLYSTAFSIPSGTLFFVCSANSIKLSVSLLVSFAFSIPLVVAFNGILTSTSSSPKSLSGVLLLGNVLNTLTILFYAVPSVPLCSIASMTNLVLPSRKSNLLFIRIIVKASMFTLSPITVILLSSLNTLVAISADPSLPLHVSILTPALMLPFITTGTKITNSLSKPFLPLNLLNGSLSISLTNISK